MSAPNPVSDASAAARSRTLAHLARATPGAAGRRCASVSAGRMNGDAHGLLDTDAQWLQQRQARRHFITSRHPARHVREQKPAATHRPADAPGYAGEREHQDRQHVAAHVNAQIILLGIELFPQAPDGRPKRPRFGPAFKPVSGGDMNVANLRIGLEHLAVAARPARRSPLRDRPRKARQDRAREHRVAHMIELHDQDPSGCSHLGRRRERTPEPHHEAPAPSRRCTRIRHRSLL